MFKLVATWVVLSTNQTYHYDVGRFRTLAQCHHALAAATPTAQTYLEAYYPGHQAEGSLECRRVV